MTPPEAPGTDHRVVTTDTPPAVSRLQTMTLQTLKKRKDFLACARAARAPMPGFLLQARNRRDDDPAIRVGFTASKKTGNAVTRNRAKRRMRALARSVMAAEGQSGWDYVLVARPGDTVRRTFAEMEAELSRALARVHAPRGNAPPSNPR